MTVAIERLRTCLGGRYGIDREIGRGGMATVYLARDVRHHRSVALKVLNPELTLAIGSERFLREIEIVAGLHHPHILPLYDSGDAEGALFYVMPYVEGESLKEKLAREQQLGIEEAIGIGREVADALSYAHERGVVHRDIKPANIMLESNHAVLSDFGVALIVRAAASAGRLTDSGLSPGTVAYMSPEQAMAERSIDGRSDIYSLGCVVYEMLTGDPPFTGANAQAVLAKKLLQPVPSVRVVRDKVPLAVDEATLKALAKTPADRFRTAAEFGRALGAAGAEVSSGRNSSERAPQRDEDGMVGVTARASALDLQVPAPDAAFPIARIVGIAAGVLALLSAIGFLTTAVYDVKMRLPAEYTPSRIDYPIVGSRALIPILFYIFLILIAFIVGKYALRLLLDALHWMAPVRRAVDRFRVRLSDTGSRLSRSVEPGTVVEVWFIGAIFVSVLVLMPFVDLLVSVSTSTRDTSMLSTSFRTLHSDYTFALTVLIACLCLAWRRVSLYVRARRATGASITLARWGGLAWILVLVLMVTMPWRLLWNNERPRALLNGERVYILLEREGDLVIYNAERRETQRYRGGDVPALERLNTEGYVFETATEFTFSRAES